MRAALHPYTHVGSGRWVCESCHVWIVNADCPVNREALTPAPPLSPTEAATVARFDAAPDALACPQRGEECADMVPCDGCPRCRECGGWSDAWPFCSGCIEAGVVGEIDRGHPCGHDARVIGCGGCDPGAVEFVIDDTTGRVTRCVWPDDTPAGRLRQEWTA